MTDTSPTELLTELQGRVNALESRAQTAQEAKSSGGLWGWIVALIVGAVVAIGGAVLVWQLNKKNEELAKLRTGVEQDKVKKASLQHQMFLERRTDKLAALALEAVEVSDRLKANEARLASELEQYEVTRARVDAARNWDQLDAANSRDR